MTTYREHSRANWYRADGQKPDLDQLKFGALQRIADATELMARRYTDLIDEAAREKARRERAEQRAERLEHVVRGLRGALTRAKGGAA